MPVKNKILRLCEHNISIDNLWVANVETEDNDFNGPNSPVKPSEIAGNIAPMIEVNGYTFDRTEVMEFVLDETGFIPTIYASVKDLYGVFTNKHFPQSKCLLKLYIKSPDANLKAIRCDFIITSIRNTGCENSDAATQGMGLTYIIRGIMNIPKLFNYNISCVHKSSYDALFDIAKNVDLGFATNEVNTNDEMGWIQSNMSYEDFIQEITLRSYKDDASFFTSYIDRYYNLTFLNMANMTEDLMPDDVSFESPSFFKDDIINTIGRESSSIVKSKENASQLALTNFIGVKGSSSFITSYSLNTDQGDALISAPNKTNIYYYDIQLSNNNDEKFVKYCTQPISTSIDSEELISNNENNMYEGLETGNVHDNYIFAKHNNIKNIEDLTKISLNVITDGVNLNILRGMRIPIRIFKLPEIANTYQQGTDAQSKAEKEMSDDGIILDVNLSAEYVVYGMKIEYNINGQGMNAFRTVLTLVKNGWKKNEKNEEV